jgi:transaldolase
MSNIKKLYTDYAVSPWLDNISRDYILDGTLARYISQGIRGVTSNPSIFEKAFSESESYKVPIQSLKDQGLGTEDIYWKLAIEDIQGACDILLPLYTASNGNDGFVSVEVSPEYARDAEATTKQAHDIWGKVSRPNVMIKIPATKECLTSIRDVVASGIHVNVTLIFSLHRYLQVIHAYMDGLEKCGDPAKVRSVASFFISRVDSLVDTLVHEKEELLGTAAVAQAQVAYGIFLESFSPHSERWVKLARAGAHIQRPLWASTSTKNPHYDPLKYVSSLLARDTVNTLPDQTITSIESDFNTSTVRAVSVEDIQLAHDALDALKAHGVDMTQVSTQLENEGVTKFQDAFRSMLRAIEAV